VYRPLARQTIEEWGREDVYFADGGQYATAMLGPYGLGAMPWFRGIQEAIQDPAVREVAVLKCTQSGGSENCLLMPLRFWVARDPAPTMYVSAQQEHAEAFLRERILPGFRASRTCREKLKRARVIGNELYFPEMMLALTWAQSTGGQKTRPMCRLLLDEVSTFSGFSLDKFRKRVVTFSETSKIVYCSTQDARGNLDSLADPMVQAWMETAQHEWHVQDPGSGRWFQPMFGVDFKTGRMAKHGVRWDHEARNTDGSWNLERVGATAHYLCPSGAVVTGAANSLPCHVAEASGPGRVSVLASASAWPAGSSDSGSAHPASANSAVHTTSIAMMSSESSWPVIRRASCSRCCRSWRLA
jgi:hypothetical protein